MATLLHELTYVEANDQFVGKSVEVFVVGEWDGTGFRLRF